jgi:hypothetical protein
MLRSCQIDIAVLIPSIDAANPEIGLIFWDPNLVTCDLWKIY